MRIFLIGMLAAVAGCHTIDVQTSREFEGRYDSAQAAADALRGKKLGKGESVWILTNGTLKNLLKNTNGK